MSALRQLVDRLRRRPVPLALGIVFFAQIYYFQWHPAYPNPNEVIRLYLTRALVEEGTVRVDSMMKRFGDVEDKAAYQGHFYCDKAPGVSFAAIPAVAFGRLFGPLDMKTARHLSWLWVIVLPSLLLLLGLWRYLGRFGLGDHARALLLLGFGLGSLQFTFGTLLFSHAFAGTLAMGAFLIVSAFKAGLAKPWKLALAGFLGGFAVISEYPAVIPVFFTFVYLCWGTGWRRAWLFALAGAVPLGLWLVYNQLAFDHPIASGYGHLADEFFSKMHQKGFMGVSTPRWEAFVGSFFAPSRGLFAYAPWLLLALPGFALLWKRPRLRGELWVALFTFLTYGYFISSFGYWVGGGTVGQRHLTPLVPFLLIPIAEVLRRTGGARPSEGPAPLVALGPLATTGDVLVRALIATGVLLTVLASIPWPYVSPAYANPLAQLSLPMWRDAILPPSLGEGVGLSVQGAACVFLTLLGAALLFIAFGQRAAWTRRLAVGGAVLTLAALAVWGHARVQFQPGQEAQQTRDRQGIARLVDVGERRPALRAQAALEAKEKAGALGADELRQLGHLLALRGDAAGALRRYRAAVAARAAR